MQPEQDEPTPGTTDDPKPDDAATGAEASEDANAGGSAEDTSREDKWSEDPRTKQLLAEKTKFEQTQRDLEEARRKPAPQPPATGDDGEGRKLYERDVQLEREMDAGVEPTLEHFNAQRRLQRVREQVRTQKLDEIERQLELARLPEDIQSDAEKLSKEERISVRLATRIIKAERAAAAKAAERNGDDDEIERKTARRDAQPTTASTPASRSSDVMTRDQYNRRLAKFDDEDDLAGKAAFVRKKNENKVRIRG
jgi:hypothetical protein